MAERKKELQTDAVARARGRCRSRGVPRVEEQEDISPIKDEPPALGRAKPAKGASLTSPGGEMTGGRLITYPELGVPTVTNPRRQFLCKKGEHGRPVLLTSNCFKVDRETGLVILQYRVDFTPEEDSISVRKGLVRSIKERIAPSYVFDGTILFTSTKLSSDLLECVIDRQEGNGQIKVTIKLVAELLEGDQNYAALVNIILKKCLHRLNYTLLGKYHYDIESSEVVEKHNLEIWPGYLVGCRQYEEDFLMKIDLVFKVLRRNTVLDVLQEYISTWPDNWKEMFEKALTGRVVLTKYNNRTYRVNDVDFLLTPNSTFMLQGEPVTYVDYYRKKYGLSISQFRQPLLVSLPKAKGIRSNGGELIMLVPELCVMTGITEAMRHDFRLMKSINEVARLEPLRRLQKTKTVLSKLLSNSAVKEEMSLWHLKVHEAMTEFTGRVLPEERICHGNNQDSLVPANGDFTRNLRGQPLLAVNKLTDWVIIYPRKVKSDVGLFLSSLKRAVSGMDFHILPPIYEEIMDVKNATYIQAIEKVYTSRGSLQLIMCITPNNRKERYDAIKKKCCTDRPIPSQIVLAKNLNPRGATSIATKIGLQVCCKIGGIPWSVRIPFSKPIMVVGFDVSRDMLHKGTSFGALAASIDGRYTRYFTAVSSHQAGQDLSDDISGNLLTAVLQFRNNLGFLPPKIVLFRDAVGEGNVKHVLEHEVTAVITKLKELYLAEQLGLAYILVNTKGKLRIYLDKANPPPGTIVDSCVTNPNKYDFFMVSQNETSDTLTPVYYDIIYDTTGLKPDIMQRLTYKLTMMYFNWSGTLSIPAPLQYAHKLAKLCSQHLHRKPSEQLSTSLYFL